PGQGFTSPVSPVTYASSTMQVSFRCGRRDNGGSTFSSPSLFASSTDGLPSTAIYGKHASTAWERRSKRNARNRKTLNRSQAHERQEQDCDSGCNIATNPLDNHKFARFRST